MKTNVNQKGFIDELCLMTKEYWENCLVINVRNINYFVR